MPAKMKLESTNICNTHCQLCPTGLGYEGRPKGVLQFEQYKQIIDRHAWHLLSLDLSMWGDPLICPDIYRMIRYAHDRRIWTYLSSNLHAMKLSNRRGGQPQVEQLVESGLDMLTCSLHGATQKTYEAYQPGKRLDDCLERIRAIVAMREKYHSQTPKLLLNFAVTKTNQHEIEAFKRLANDLGCEANIQPAMMNTRFCETSQPQKPQPLGLADDLREKHGSSLMEQWLPDQLEQEPGFYEHYRKQLPPTDVEQYNGRKTYPCSWPWFQTVINWDGGVSVCCGGFHKNEDMGNALQNSLRSIWNSEKYRIARRSFRKPVDPKHATDNACVACPGIML